MSDTQVIAALQRQAQQAEAERLRLVEEVERLRAIVSACEWVPAGVRLPEPNVTVLVTDGELMALGVLNEYPGAWFPWVPSHWMPLPEGPK